MPANPYPADGETHVPRDTLLAWTANSHAPPNTVYEVYFSTNALPAPDDLLTSSTNLSAVLTELDRSSPAS